MDLKGIPQVKVKPTESEEEGMQMVYELLSGGARRVGEGFEDPDDDWAPLWFVLTPEGLGTFIGTDLFTEDMKHMVAGMVGSLARELGAHVVGFVASSWMISQDDVPEGEHDQVMKMHQAGVPIHDMPWKTERLMISIHTASQIRLYNAKIERTDSQPPRLSPFECMSSEKTGEISGAMVTPIQAGLRRMG